VRLPDRWQTLQSFQSPKVAKKFQKSYFGRNFPGMFPHMVSKEISLSWLFFFPGFALRNPGAPIPSESIYFQRLVFMKFVSKF
jgi:hypothetical protein